MVCTQLAETVKKVRTQHTSVLATAPKRPITRTVTFFHFSVRAYLPARHPHEAVTFLRIDFGFCSMSRQIRPDRTQSYAAARDG